MNILSSNLKTNFVPSLLSMCPTQKMQFHYAASPLSNVIENNGLSAQSPCRIFKNPNFFNHNTHEENIPSSYKKTDQFEVTQNEELEKHQNSSEMIAEELEKTDFGSEIMVQSSKSFCQGSSRKRARKGKNKKRITEKHNEKREIVNEMMNLDFSNDSTDISLTPNTSIDQEMEENHSNTVKLCDFLVLPGHSSPVGIPMIDISMETTKLPTQMTCIRLSISPPNMRQRQLSMTESEDSFIVFDSGTDEECDFSEDAGSASDQSSEEEEVEDESSTDSPGSIVPTKKVRFADDKELCEIHPMIQWSFAYQAARKGPWEACARDRDRFKNRICLVGEKIGHCFEPDHRQKVYNQRFKMDE